MTLLSGATVSVGEALLRFLAIAAYVTVSLLGLSAIGLFLSTLTTVPVGAMAATAILAVVVADHGRAAAARVRCIRGSSPTTGSASPTCCASRRCGTRSSTTPLLQAGYVVVFGALAVGRFLTKDVLS